MTTDQILNWLDLDQGSASKRSIRTVWSLFGDEDETVYVTPNSRGEKGLS